MLLTIGIGELPFRCRSDEQRTRQVRSRQICCARQDLNSFLGAIGRGMQMPYRIGIIGLGKIARDQHIPSIQANATFELVAASSQGSIGLEGVPHAFSDYRDMLKVPELDAVAICTPPQVRYAIARDALRA